jgi:general secretion pathway protein D
VALAVPVRALHRQTRDVAAYAPMRLIIAIPLCLSLSGGCERQPEPAISALPALPGAATAATPRINGEVGTPEATPPPQLALGHDAGSATPVQRPSSGAEIGGDISLDFADTDIREVVAQILGNLLKVNYAIDPAVHGTATLRTVRPLTRAALLPTLQSLLAQSGAALVQSGTLYRIVPAAQATATLGTDQTAGSVVVPLRYASADDLAKVLQPFVGEGGKIATDPGRNALLVGGDPQARASLLDLIRTFDVDVLARQSYAVLSVGASDVRDFAGALQDALRGQSGGALAGLVRVVPLSRIGAVLVISSQARYIEEARRVYALVDRTRRQTIRSWHVYYLQNSNASDIAYTLQQAFTPNNVTAQPSTLAQGSGMASQRYGLGGGTGGLGGGSLRAGIGGGLMQRGLSTGGLGGGGLGGGGAAGGNLTGSILGPPGASVSDRAAGGAATSPPAQAPAGNPLLGGLDTSGIESNPDTLRIIPDPQNNGVLIYGTQRETGTIEAMLRKIDILPLQVRIDAVIAEVTLNDNLQYGTQFFFRAGGINGILSFAQQAPVARLSNATLNAAFPGFIVGGTGNGGAPFALSALQAVTTVDVLSSPQLLVLDNQPARLQVGNVVPYLTQTSQSTLVSNAPIVSSINYQQTGVIMEVTPRVNSGGLVTLDIMQDVSAPQTTLTTPGINSPTFSERNVTSRVVVQDGQTIGLAGLITDNVTRGNQGIPWLKDVPLLGFLAGNQNNTRQRTELLVLITPHVVHDQRDARALTEDLRDQLINAAAIPEGLNGLPPSGSSDPGARMRQRLRPQR